MSTRSALTLLVLVACSGEGDRRRASDGGPEDAGRTGDAGLPDARPRDADARDAGGDVLPLCVEVEALPRRGDVAAFASAGATGDGVVVLGTTGASDVRLRFTLAAPVPVAIWARVRAPTRDHASLYAGVDRDPRDVEGIWDVPVTPVLRWARVGVRGPAGTAWRGVAGWPGSVGNGEHELVLAGRQPGVEIDAVCVTAGAAPAEPVVEIPVRPVMADAREAGAIGDGVADDRTALNLALSRVEPGGTLRIPAGRYRIPIQLSWHRSEITIEGERAPDGTLLTTLYFDYPVGGGSNNAILVEGSRGPSPVPLLEDAAFLSREVVVAEEVPARFVPGTYVELSSPPWGTLVGTDPQFRNRAALARVVAREAKEGRARITLDRPLLSPFFVAHGTTLVEVSPQTGLVLRDLRIEGPTHHLEGLAPGAGYEEWTDARRDLNRRFVGLNVGYCAGCAFVGLELAHLRQESIRLRSCLDCRVEGSVVRDMTDWVGDPPNGYGIAVYAGQGTVLRDNRFTGVMRHPIVLSTGTRGSFISGNTCERPDPPHPHMSSNIDLHGEDDYANLVEGNTIHRGYYGVLVGGGGSSHANDGPWNVIRDNAITGALLQGIAVVDHSHDTIVEDNRIAGGGTGIAVVLGNERATVWRNRVDAVREIAVDIQGAVTPQIIGNEIAGTGRAIVVDAATTGYEIRENVLHGGSLEHPGTGTVADNR